MVLIVVEEPRGGVHYGSQTAGPTAIAVLLEAIELTRNGQPFSRAIPAAVTVPLEVSRGLSEDPVLEIPEDDEEEGR